MRPRVIIICAFLWQTANAQYGEVRPPSPSPPPSYNGLCPPCGHYDGYSESPAQGASSLSLEQSVSSSPYQPASEPIPVAPQKDQSTTVLSSSTGASHLSLTTTDEWLATTTESSSLPTELATASSQTQSTGPSITPSPSNILWTGAKSTLETSQVTLKASSATEILRKEHSSTNAMPSSFRTTLRNVQPTSSSPSAQQQEGQKIQLPKPVDLQPHTPISAPSLPGGKLVKTMPPSRIPPRADKNEVSPTEPEEVPEEKFAFTDCLSDTLFVVDSTSSVRRYFEHHRQYVLNTVNLLEAIGDKGTRIGVIVYSSKQRKQIKIPFGRYKNRSEVEIAIKGLPYFSGITATGAALNLSLEALRARRPNVPTNVVVITDGFSYDIVDGPAAELHRLPNVRTFTVTVTDAWREFELQTIAGNPHRVFKGMESVPQLVTALKSCNSGPRKGDIIPDEPIVASFLSSKAVTAATTTATSAARASIFTTTRKETLKAKPSKGDKIKPTSVYKTTKPKPPSSLSSSSSSSRSNEQESTTSTLYSQPPLNRLATTSSKTIRESSSSTQSISATTSLNTTECSTTHKSTAPAIRQQASTTHAPETVTKKETTASASKITPMKVVPPAPFKTNGKGCPFDIMIVLDASGSLQTRFQRQLELTIRLVDRLTIGPQDARVAVIKYAGRRKSRLAIPFNKYTDKESLRAALKKVVFIGGTTYTNEALLKADEVLSGADGRRTLASPIVIVFTDGFSHDDPAPGAAVLRNKGIPIYAVGINDIYPVNVHELLTIAGEESRVFLDKKTAQFENELAELTRGCLKMR